MTCVLTASQKWIELGGEQFGSLSSSGFHELFVEFADVETRDAMYVKCSETLWKFYSYLSSTYPRATMSVISRRKKDVVHFKLN